MGAHIDGDRVRRLTEQMEESLRKKTAASGRFVEEAKEVLPAGVASSFQDVPPHPVFITGGKGSRVWDLDGNEYSDYHNGFGGTTILAPGKYKVASLAITVAPGKTPVLAPVHTSPLDANFYTAFGSTCPGNSFDSTLKLGDEFGDSCGPGAPTATRATTWGAIKTIYR